MYAKFNSKSYKYSDNFNQKQLLRIELLLYVFDVHIIDYIVADAT